MAWRLLSAIMLLVMGGIHLYLVFDGVGGSLGVLFVLNAVIQKAWDPSTPNVRTAVINMSTQLSGDGFFDAVEQKIRDMVSGVDKNGNPSQVASFGYTIAPKDPLADRKVKRAKLQVSMNTIASHGFQHGFHIFRDAHSTSSKRSSLRTKRPQS